MQPIGACAPSPAISASPAPWYMGFGSVLPCNPTESKDSKLSNDPKFEEKVRDVVGLYLDPPERALVLCVDEKSQIQALDRTAPILPLRPGLPERQTHDYKRQGPPRCLPPSTSSTARSLAVACRAIGVKNSLSFSISSRRKCLRNSMSISFWTT